MAKVALTGMKFYAFHGYYAFERRVGDYFELNVEVDIQMDEDPDEKIDQTLDYELIYQVSENYMMKKYLLMESLAYDIARELKSTDTRVNQVCVELSKLNPRVGGKADRATVTIKL